MASAQALAGQIEQQGLATLQPSDLRLRLTEQPPRSA